MTKSVTRRMAVDCLLWYFYERGSNVLDASGMHSMIKCAICGHVILWGQRIQFDHTHAIIHEGPHEYQNLRPLHADCHKIKTKSDIQANSKIKRIRGETKQGPKRAIPSRPFSKASRPMRSSRP